MRPLGERAGFGNTSQLHGSTPERVEGADAVRVAVLRAAPSLSAARAPAAIANHPHLGRDCPLSWTSRTSWTLAATRLIIRHGPFWVARSRHRPSTAFSCLSRNLSDRRQTPQCTAAAAAPCPGRAGIPLSIQLVGHESGPGSAEACLPSPPSTPTDRASIRCHRPLSPLPVAVLTHRLADKRAA
jgi:hypothetical protein